MVFAQGPLHMWQLVTLARQVEQMVWPQERITRSGLTRWQTGMLARELGVR